MVYLFAGASRRGDIREHLQSLADNQFHLELKELDLELHHSHDLSKTKLWDDLYSEIDQGKWTFCFGRRLATHSAEQGTTSNMADHDRYGRLRGHWGFHGCVHKTRKQHKLRISLFSNAWRLQDECIYRTNFSGVSIRKI